LNLIKYTVQCTVYRSVPIALAYTTFLPTLCVFSNDYYSLF
jgi:hypothetical protein